MSDLVLRALSKTYGQTPVLADLDLVARKGELIVLVGPSGCGKSTLLKLVAGLEPPDTGSVHLNGRDITGAEPRHRNIAMVFQNYALYPHLSVADNMAYPLRRLKRPAAEIAARVAETAGLLDLQPLLNRRPAQLSGGQKQRVAMARAIIRDPDLFLLDEPLSNLDTGLRGQVRAEILALQRRLGRTMLYVTHDQVDAQTMADRVVILRGGHIQQNDTAQAIYDRPANMFAAAFLCTSPPNFVTAMVENGHMRIGSSTLPLTAFSNEMRSALAGRGPLIIGIRPESLCTPSGAPGLALSGEILHRDTIGSEQLVHFRPDDPALVDPAARDRIEALSGRRPPQWLTWATARRDVPDTGALEFPVQDLMIFDAAGDAIGPPSGFHA